MLDPEKIGKTDEILLISCLEAIKYTQSKFTGRHLAFFPLPVWSHSILICLNGKLDPENIGIAVGISLISCLEAEIHTFEVLRPPSWIFPLPAWLQSI